MLLRKISEKALLWSAFLFPGITQADAQCPAPVNAQTIQVVYVYDGDTVRLSDGSSLRLIGVNTPEINAKKGRPEPGALEAHRFLEAYQSQITMLTWERQRQDRYGRSLGHLYLSDGRSVEALLLEQGLGYRIAIPPNTRFNDCLAVAESQARKQGIGLWAGSFDAVVPAATLKPGRAGFSLLSGSITRVSFTPRAWYLELDNQVALKISLPVAGGINKGSLNALKGQKIEVRGWLIDRRSRSKTYNPAYKPWLMVISHASHIRISP
ncbi:MAG: thermonuclease family protein [Pontibacterium sp.]